ncbi:MAG: DUF2341 domain-containing protein [Candidatus Odinarchaeota archaeon]
MITKQIVFSSLIIAVLCMNYISIVIIVDIPPPEKKEKIKKGQKTGQEITGSSPSKNDQAGANISSGDDRQESENDKQYPQDTQTVERGISRGIAGVSSSPTSNREHYIDAVTDYHLPADYGSIDDWTRMQATDGSYSTLSENAPRGNYETDWKNASGNINNGWTNPQNMYTSNDLRADLTGINQNVTLINFNLPSLSGFTITGIVVQVEGYYDVQWPDVFDVVLLWNGRTSATSAKAISLPKLVINEAYVSAGGPTNTWGRTWNGATDFTDANFGVKLIASTSATLKPAHVDHVRVKIYYENADHDFDREFSFTDVPRYEENYKLSIKTGLIGSESLRVDVWNASSASWTDIMTITDADNNTWKNASISAYLSSTNVHFRFTDNIILSDSTNNTWQIDSILISFNLVSTYFFHRKNITIDYNKVDATLTDFPVLIDIYDADLNKSQSDGRDIIFADTSGFKLPHEIEKFDRTYNNTHAHLVAWVKVPVLSGSSYTNISMYYKNSTVSNQANPAAVWENDFLTVHHMEENPGGSITDSTGNYNMISAGTMGTGDLVEAVIGKGVDFDGIDDEYISESSITLKGSFSLSLWFKVITTGKNQSLISLDFNAGSSEYRKLWINETNYLLFSAKGFEEEFGTVTADTWYHVFIVYDELDDSLKAYSNGSLVPSPPTQEILSHTEIFRFAGYEDQENFTGILDEVRITNTTRSAEWISAEYRNQHDPASFYSIDQEEYAQDYDSPIVIGFGVTDPGDGNPQFWAEVIDDSSGVTDVILDLDGTEHEMTLNASDYWVYEPLSLNFGDSFDYFITNVTDNSGKSNTTDTVIKNVIFDYDTVFPEVIDWEFYTSLDKFNANVSDAWGTIHTVIVNVTDRGGIIAVMRNTAAGYVNDTLSLLRGTFSFVITVNDTAGNTRTSDPHAGYSSGAKPVADNLMLTPVSPRSNDTLQLNYDYFDADGDLESGTEIRWYNNSELQPYLNDMKTVPSSFLIKHHVWYVTVKPKDGTKFGVIKTAASVTVQNTLPEFFNYAVTPGVPTNLSDLTASYVYSDIDGDTLVFEIEWYKNGENQTNLYNKPLVGATNTTKGEDWSFRIRAHDGDGYSLWYQAVNATVVNSAPTIIGVPTFNETVGVSQNDNLNISYLYYDADNDAEVNITVELYVRWYKWTLSNGVEAQPQKNNQTLLSWTETTDNDVWYYFIRVFDGSVYSDVYESVHVSIAFENNRPVASLLNVTTASNDNFTVDNLFANYTFSDGDGHFESGTRFVWFYKRDGTEYVYINTTLTQLNNITIRTILAGLTKKGDLWWFGVRVGDGIDYAINWENSSKMLIRNSIPVVTDVTITAEAFNTTDLVAISWVFNDDDIIDGEYQRGWNVTWYLGGVRQNHLDNKTVVEAGNTTKGEDWYFIVLVFDGENWSLGVSSDTITIQNSLPYITNLVVTGGQVTDDDVLISYTFVDADNDTNNTIIDWKVYRGLVLVYHYYIMPDFSLSAGQFVAGDIINCTITPKDDSLDNGTVVIIIIPVLNSAPYLAVNNLQILGLGNITDYFSNNRIYINYSALTNAYDADIDNLNYYIDRFSQDGFWFVTGTSYRWYRNGKLVAGITSPFVDPQYLVEGDEWHVSISIKDRYGGYSPWYDSPSITIINSPPEIHAITWSSTTPVDGQDLTILSYYFDHDGDDEDKTRTVIKWYNNGIHIPENEDKVVLSHILFKRGDNISVNITPHDGLQFGSEYNSTDFTGLLLVINAPPLIRSITLNDNSPVYTSDNLTLVWDYYDADGDTQDKQQVNIHWYLFNDSTTTWDHQIPFDDLDEIPSANTTKGQRWSIELRVYDGYTYSNWFIHLPNFFIVQNSPIVITGALITVNGILGSSNATASDLLTIDIGLINYTDADNDEINDFKIYWFVDSIYQLQFGTGTVTILSSYLTKGESWGCYISVADNDGSWSENKSSQSVFIENSQMVINWVQINNNITEAYVTDDLIVQLEFFDFDGDTEYIDYITYWYVDGNYRDDLMNYTEIASSELVKHQEWYCIYRVADSEGLWSANKTSQTIVILNSKPSVSGIVLIYGHDESVVSSTNPESPDSRDFLLLDEILTIDYIFLDDDSSDKDQSVIYWFKNGILQDLYTNQKILPAVATSLEETWRFEIWAYDGEEYGFIFNSSNFVIRSRPTVNGLGQEPQTDIEGFYFLWVNTTDALNEIDRVIFNITIQGLNNYNLTRTIRETNGTANIFVWNNIKLTEILENIQETSFIDLIGTNITVVVTVKTRIGIYEIKRTANFTFTIEDNAPPRVLAAAFIWNYAKEGDYYPVNITFFAEIEEFGKGIENVLLFYYFQAVSGETTVSGNGALFFQRIKHVQDDYSFTSIPMIRYNETHYSVTVDYAPTENTLVYFKIQVTDAAGNINYNAFPNGLNDDWVSARGLIIDIPPFDILSLLPFIIVFVAIVAVLAFGAIKIFSGTELVGLDIDKVMDGTRLNAEDEIKSSQDLYTLGIVVSTFDQLDGPIPVFVEPILLKDNFNKLLELSDLSFSAIRFADDFSVEIPSTFDFFLDSGVRITSVAFGYALDRPDERGGSENVTLNILVHKLYGSLVFQFVDQLIDQVHEIHIKMDKQPSEKKSIANEVIELRKLVTSILLSYEKLYGVVEEGDEEEKGV